MPGGGRPGNCTAPPGADFSKALTPVVQNNLMHSSSPPAHDVAIALIVACAMFMAQLDGAVAVLAMPAPGASFHVPAVAVTAGITSYLMVQVAAIPASGWIADRGAKRVFAASIVLFAPTSALQACTSATQFASARALQGAAAAIMTPVSRIAVVAGHATSPAAACQYPQQHLHAAGTDPGSGAGRPARRIRLVALDLSAQRSGGHDRRCDGGKLIAVTAAIRTKPFDFAAMACLRWPPHPSSTPACCCGDPLKWPLPVACW